MNLVKRENIALVSFTNASNSSGMIKLKISSYCKLRLALCLAYA